MAETSNTWMHIMAYIHPFRYFRTRRDIANDVREILREDKGYDEDSPNETTMFDIGVPTIQLGTPTIELEAESETSLWDVLLYDM